MPACLGYKRCMYSVAILSLTLFVLSCGQGTKRDQALEPKVEEPKVENSDAGAKVRALGDKPKPVDMTRPEEVAEPKELAELQDIVTKPKLLRIEKRNLAAPSGGAYAYKKANTRTLSVKSSKVFLGDSPPSGSSFVVGTGRGRQLKWFLVDVITNKRLAAFGSSWDGSAVGKVAVVGKNSGEDATQSLLHMADGTMVEPKPRLPGGETLSAWRIVVDSQSPTVWLFAKSKSGKTYHGQWKDTHKPEVAMADFPFWPAMASGARGIVVWNTEATATTCSRYELIPGQAPKCRPGRLGYAGFGSEPLAEMWTLHDGALLRNDEDGRQVSLLADCRGAATSTLKSPPRVLAICTPEPNMARFLLWSPDKSWQWDGPFDKDALMGGIRRHPVIALEQVGKMNAPVSRWVDMERGIEWTSEPVATLSLASAFGFGRQVLGRPLSHPKQLWLFDLESGTSELITDNLECKGELREDDNLNGRAIISCRSKRGPAWSEVIDFKARTRWRTNSVFGARLSEGGIATGVLRGRPAKLAVIETK